MKSTGLFGKNSGRVGGVVYSNYRGQQIVRSYQPKVRNPKSEAQMAQRARFKLVSQVAAEFGSQIALSYEPSKASESPRNSFIRDMLERTTFESNVAELPIEALVLTKSSENWIVSIDSANSSVVSGTMSTRFAGVSNTRVRAIFIGHNQSGQIQLLDVKEGDVTTGSNGVPSFSIPVPNTVPYSTRRVLLYGYQYNVNELYLEDYELNGSEINLEVISKIARGSIQFSSTVNQLITENV